MDNFKKSGVVSLIKYLEDDDIKELKMFLKSPFFATNKTLERFFLAIIKYRGNFEHKRFTAANCYNKVFPGKPFNKGTFNNMLVKLKSAIEEYFAHQEVKRNSKLKSAFTRKGYLKRNYKNRFIQKSESQLEEYASKKNKTAEDYLDIMQVNQELYEHNNMVRIASEAAQTRIVSCMENLDRFYFTLKMFYSAELINRRKIYNMHYEIRFFEAIEEHGHTAFESSDAMFYFYLQLVKLREDPTEDNYAQLRTTFTNHGESLSKTHQLMMLTALNNHVITKLTQGNVSYQNELFSLYKKRDELNLFIDNNMLGDVAFCNVISTALTCHKIKWTKNFIEKYKDTLEQSQRTDALTYAEALLAFYEKQYDKTLNIVRTFTNRSLNYDLRIRPLSIQTHYELSMINKNTNSDPDSNYDETIELEIKAMRAFLTNRKVAQHQSIRYRNFCSICLALINGNKTKEDLLKLVEKKKNLLSKTWILEKIQQT